MTHSGFGAMAKELDGAISGDRPRYEGSRRIVELSATAPEDRFETQLGRRLVRKGCTASFRVPKEPSPACIKVTLARRKSAS